MYRSRYNFLLGICLSVYPGLTNTRVELLKIVRSSCFIILGIHFITTRKIQEIAFPGIAPPLNVIHKTFAVFGCPKVACSRDGAHDFFYIKLYIYSSVASLTIYSRYANICSSLTLKTINF